MKKYCEYCDKDTRHECEGDDETWVCQECVEDLGLEDSSSDYSDDSYQSDFIDDK